jgi:hypothetical protein
VTIATVARETDGLVVHVIDGQERPDLEHLRSVQARDCDELAAPDESTGCDGDNADRIGQGSSRSRAQAGAQRRKSGR